MGAYITGVPQLGTIFNGLMASMLDKTGLFPPYALGMAAWYRFRFHDVRCFGSLLLPLTPKWLARLRLMPPPARC